MFDLRYMELLAMNKLIFGFLLKLSIHEHTDQTSISHVALKGYNQRLFLFGFVCSARQMKSVIISSNEWKFNRKAVRKIIFCISFLICEKKRERVWVLWQCFHMPGNIFANDSMKFLFFFFLLDSFGAVLSSVYRFNYASGVIKYTHNIVWTFFFFGICNKVHIMHTHPYAM